MTSVNKATSFCLTAGTAQSDVMMNVPRSTHFFDGKLDLVRGEASFRNVDVEETKSARPWLAHGETTRAI